MTTTIGDLLRDARRRLGGAPFEPARREAALLLGHVLGLREAQVLARTERVPTASERGAFAALLARRLRGEPVAYLLGEREFYGRPFAVDERVLIPRPETEHLIEAALALAPALPARPRIVDVGTGSGCIALTLALELPTARVLALDRSLAALAVAARNRARLGRREGDDTLRRRVDLAACDLATALDPAALAANVDLLVSNPPYVDTRERGTLSPEVVDFEPAVALFAPGAGHVLVERLLDVVARLRPGTPAVLEIGYDQADWLRAAVAARPGLVLERLIADYAGIPRTAVLTAAAT